MIAPAWFSLCLSCRRLAGGWRSASEPCLASSARSFCGSTLSVSVAGTASESSAQVRRSNSALRVRFSSRRIRSLYALCRSTLQGVLCCARRTDRGGKQRKAKNKDPKNKITENSTEHIIDATSVMSRS